MAITPSLAALKLSLLTNACTYCVSTDFEIIGPQSSTFQSRVHVYIHVLLYFTYSYTYMYLAAQGHHSVLRPGE